MELKTLSINEWFTIKLKVKKLVIKKVKGILEDNNFKFDIKYTGFEGFYDVSVKNCNIKTADSLRRLLKAENIISFI